MPPPPVPAVPNRPKGISAFLRQPQPALSSELTSDPFDPLSQSSPARVGSVAPAPRVLAVDLSPSVVRPIAFRVFTKKHNLTLKSDALQLLAQFIGRRCGAEWRDKGAGEKLLDEVARQWKRSEGAGKVLVDGGEALKNVLKGLEVPGGSTGVGKEMSPGLNRSGSGLSMVEDFPSSMLMGGEELGGGADVEMAEGDDIDTMDPREYFKIVDAFEQPKLVYNSTKKIFEKYGIPRPLLLSTPNVC
jgi:DNA polymerase epsilon subunit 2